MADLQRMCRALQEGEVDEVTALARQALDDGVDAETILSDALLRGMDVVGEKFKVNEMFVPDVIFAARAMTAAMEVLQPILTERGVEPVGRVVIGTVKGDLHDIGKNLVGMMLKGGGFKVVDMGIDVSPEAFVEAAKSENAEVIALSALLTTTMPQMKNVVDAVKAAGISTKTMIGGAPVTQEYADEIGAEGYAPDAASAVDKAKELVG
jgi:5-methyltetrahydrofolate--homocysteine methyltransferase